MNTPRDEDCDPDWWKEKTKTITRDYCPACQPEVDPTKELVTVCYCSRVGYQPTSEGNVDFLSRADKNVWPVTVEGV